MRTVLAVLVVVCVGCGAPGITRAPPTGYSLFSLGAEIPAADFAAGTEMIQP